MRSIGGFTVLAATLVLIVGLGTDAQGNVLYVDDNASGANTGSSWIDAFKYLQDALSAAASSDEIRIAQGIYRPDQGALYLPGDRGAFFNVVRGVMLKGGYAGLGAKDPDARDAGLYRTILTGDLNGDDADVEKPSLLLTEPTLADNSLRVMTMLYAEPPMVLDGCTITGGTQAGVESLSGNPTIVACTFLRNSNTSDGGAIYAAGGHLTLTRCRFVSNLTTKSGGAIYTDGVAALSDCVFENNEAGGDGGAVRSEGSSLTVARCSFLQNRGDTGGAVEYDGNAGTARISNCTFSENATTGESVVERGRIGQTDAYLTSACGGALHVSATSSLPNISESNIDVTDCLFDHNSTTNVGGAVYVEVPAKFQRCRFIANQARHGGAVCTNAKGEFTNCLFAGNSADGSGGAIACVGANDVLTHCTFAGNVSPSGRALASQFAIPFGTFRPDLTGGAIGHVTWGGKTTLSHCIVWDGSGEFAVAESLEINVAYSDVFGSQEGKGNIQVDPCFADAGYWDPRGTPADSQDDVWVNGDYHLKSQGGRWNALEEIWVKDDATSACVDAGDPNSSLGDELFPNGGVVNLGAYAGTTQASKSWFGAPVPEVHLAGDINGDGMVDLKDLFVVISQWSIGTPPPVQERLFIGIVAPKSGTGIYVGAQPVRFLAHVSIFDAAVAGVTFTIRNEEGTYRESFDAQESLDGWSIAWPPADAGQELPLGKYVITAQATDEKGHTAVSPSITISLSQRTVRR